MDGGGEGGGASRHRPPPPVAAATSKDGAPAVTDENAKRQEDNGGGGGGTRREKRAKEGDEERSGRWRKCNSEDEITVATVEDDGGGGESPSSSPTPSPSHLENASRTESFNSGFGSSRQKRPPAQLSSAQLRPQLLRELSFPVGGGARTSMDLDLTQHAVVTREPQHKRSTRQRQLPRQLSLNPQAAPPPPSSSSRSPALSPLQLGDVKRPSLCEGLPAAYAMRLQVRHLRKFSSFDVSARAAEEGRGGGVRTDQRHHHHSQHVNQRTNHKQQQPATTTAIMLSPLAGGGGPLSPSARRQSPAVTPSSSPAAVAGGPPIPSIDASSLRRASLSPSPVDERRRNSKQSSRSRSNSSVCGGCPGPGAGVGGVSFGGSNGNFTGDMVSPVRLSNNNDSSLSNSNNDGSQGKVSSNKSIQAGPRTVTFDKRRPQTLELDLSSTPASAAAARRKRRRRASWARLKGGGGGEEAGGEEYDYDDYDDDDDSDLLTDVDVYMTTEEELKLRRASLVIGVVAALIFLCCAAMVAVTLYLTPEMDKLAAENSKGSQSLSLLLLRFQRWQHRWKTQAEGSGRSNNRTVAEATTAGWPMLSGGGGSLYDM